MMVSVLIPAYRAEATIGAAVGSLLAQTWRSWEAIVVADDGRDYAATLAGLGVADPRLRFVSTGKIRSGCHNGRNVGMAAAAGEIVAQLDADDSYDPRRLAILAPLAAAHGAAADNVAALSEATGALLYTALPETGSGLSRLSADAFMRLDAPLFPVLRRELAMPRLASVEYAEDVVANLRLIDRLGVLPAIPQALYRYRVASGSLCHDVGSGAAFEAAYSAYLDRLRDGDAFGLSRARDAALRGIERKRALNRRFMIAQQGRPDLTFPDFLAQHQGAAASPGDAAATAPPEMTRA